MNCVMISCQRRAADRRRTIPQLQAVGLEPKVFTSPCDEKRPASQQSNGEVSGRALAWARDNHGPTLFVEDDIDLADDFAWFLNRADPTVTTYFYINEQIAGRMHRLYGHELTHAIENGLPIERQFIRPGGYWGLFGTQCVLLPEDVTRILAKELQTPKEACDGHLLRLLARDARDVRVALPNPVQHRNSRVARAGSDPKLSYSHDCPRA